MKTRLLIATALAAAAVTTAGCSTETAVDAATSQAAEISNATAVRLSEACRRTKQAASDLAAQADTNPPAALTSANTALDKVAVSVANISVPPPVKAAWGGVVRTFTTVGDAINQGVVTAAKSGSGQATQQAADEAAQRAKGLATRFTAITADLGLTC